MSGKVIDSMRSFMQDKNIEANQCKVNLLRTPNIGFIKSFNPVCFWFLEIKKECKLFVAEVKNTFYEDQIYIVENNGKLSLKTFGLRLRRICMFLLLQRNLVSINLIYPETHLK